MLDLVIRKIKQLFSAPAISRQFLKADFNAANMQPSNFDGFVKLGTEYGGWHMPKDLNLQANDVCYLAGAGEDLSFDCALAMLFPCQIHIFDPTPKAIRHYEQLINCTMAAKPFVVNHNPNQFYEITVEALSRISFHPWGLAGNDCELNFYYPANPDHVSCSVLDLQKTGSYFTAPCFSVSTIAKKLGHRQIKLLKMDIEGAEYQVIQDLAKNGPMPELLAVEFDELHTPLDDNAQQRVDDSIDLLGQIGMKLVFMEASNALFLREI